MRSADTQGGGGGGGGGGGKKRANIGDNRNAVISMSKLMIGA